jgi:polysaccharide biosynthesis/export protein
VYTIAVRRLHLVLALCLCLILAKIGGLAQSPASPVKSFQGSARTASLAQDPRAMEEMLQRLGLRREDVLRQAESLGIPPEQYLMTLLARIESDSLSRDSVKAPELPTNEPAQPSISPGEPPVSRPAATGPGGLPYFGYDVFVSVPRAFEPTAAGPVDPEYIIGADDVLKLTVWGQVEIQQELTVDREGRVFIPTVGQVLVTGMSLHEATEKLRRQMARSYSGLVSRPPTAWLDLTVARLRPKRVFVMGEVYKPGGYTMASQSTVFSALYSVGGPSVNGSLRDIRVVRGGTVITHVDLYDYLTGADRTNDLRVQDNDIVFVPMRGITASVRGEVRRPAIYELKAGEGLSALLRLAGGVLPTAYDVQAQIDRIRPFGKRPGGVDDRIVVDVPLRAVLQQGADAMVADGDEVRIFPVLDERRNFVSIDGSVWRPGRYELGVIRTVRGLIAAAAGIQPRTYTAFAHLTRLNADLMTRRIISFDLARLLQDSTHDIILEPRDQVHIYSTEIVEVKQQYVTVRGSIKNPGQYPLNAGMTLKDLIPLAGGYTEDAELLEAEVSRVRPADLRGDTLAVVYLPVLPRSFSPGTDTMIGGEPDGGEFFLLHRDEILVRPNPAYITQQHVRVTGDIRYPGTYSIRRRGERLSELLERAGGPTRTSYMGGARFFRGGERLLLDFKGAFEQKDLQHDVVMLDGDSLYIPSKPHTVLVSGEINNPGLLSFIEGADVLDYIDRAGGLTDSSNYAVLIKPTGESRRVDFGLFSRNPTVPEGSMIEVLKVPPPGPEGAPVDISGTIRDSFAILMSAATVAFIVWQVSQ